MPSAYRLRAEFFKAVGHPLRLQLLELLAQGEQAVADLLQEIPVAQAYLSQQLGVLRRAGLVVARREGSRAIYALSDPRIAELLETSRDIMVDRLQATREQLHRS